MIKIIRKLLAWHYKVPFRQKVWYNCQAMLGRDHEYKTFVECFDKDGNYIYPIKGLDVIYYVKGKRYVYTGLVFKVFQDLFEDYSNKPGYETVDQGYKSIYIKYEFFGETMNEIYLYSP